MLLLMITVKKLLERFIKKNCKVQIKQSLELKKQSKKTVTNYISYGKVVNKISYFPEQFTYSLNEKNVELELANYATKSDLKNNRC